MSCRSGLILKKTGGYPTAYVDAMGLYTAQKAELKILGFGMHNV